MNEVDRTRDDGHADEAVQVVPSPRKTTWSLSFRLKRQGRMGFSLSIVWVKQVT